MNLQYDDVIKLIKEKSSLSDEEIKKKIDDKLTQLSGLISKEGAAHIIANDLGINFTEIEKKLKINKILAGARNVETVGKVLQKYEIREFNSSGRAGKVANLLMGDETGNIRLVFWNDLTEKFKEIKEGDVIKITSAYARANNNRAELHLNDQSSIVINPSGEKVEAVQTAPSFGRKKVSELSESDESVEILGTIVQAFEPRFFEVDPETGRRMRPANDGKYYGASGTEVNPDYSYVFNLFFDDGSENIRIVCFRNQMQALLSKTHEEILVFKENPSLFESTKHELLGKMVKIQGRVVKNEMFDRLEVIASRIYPEPNPSEEIKKVENSVVQPSGLSSQEPNQKIADEPKEESNEFASEVNLNSDDNSDSVSDNSSNIASDADESLKSSSNNLGIEDLDSVESEKDSVVNSEDSIGNYEDSNSDGLGDITDQEKKMNSDSNVSDEDLGDLDDMEPIEDLDEPDDF